MVECRLWRGVVIRGVADFFYSVSKFFIEKGMRELEMISFTDLVASLSLQTTAVKVSLTVVLRFESCHSDQSF